MPEQLLLPVVRRDDSTFDTFLGAVCPEPLAAVRALLAGGESRVCLWGEPGTGRSHLLAAVIDQASRNGERVAFLAAAEGVASPAVLEGVAESASLVGIDDIDLLAGQRSWEEALFHLYNGLLGRGARLLVSAAAAPANQGWVLPDLASRLASGLVIRMPSHDDAALIAVLMHRARLRGLEMPSETAQWLLQRAPRRADELLKLLAQLDRAAWVHQRRLTLPFVREQLADGLDPAAR